MAAYNILEARNNLSRLVAAAESGAEVTIMRRGRPVARIVAFEDAAPRRSGAEIVAWLNANPLPESSRRTAEQIEATIRELREAGE